MSINNTGGDGGAGYSYDKGTNSYKITSAGSYILDEDISTSNSFAIEIAASDVTLDGNSHTITYTGTDKYRSSGVLIDSTATGVTVANIAEVSGFGYGIRADGNDAVIENNTATNNRIGIESFGANVTISDNTANINTWGISSHGANVTISANTANENTDTGIYSIGADAVISDNTATHNDRHGIFSEGANSVISNNTATNNKYYGIASPSANTVISNNTANSNKWGIGIGIDGGNATVSGNTANDNGETGIWSQSANSVFSNNTASGNVYGIISYGVNTTISDNTASNNQKQGILSYGKSAAISGNLVNGSTYGIESQGKFATITSNTVTDNTNFGIKSTGDQSTIGDNYLNNNTNYGIQVKDGDNSIISDNQVNGSVTGIYNNLGTGTAISGNTVTNNSKSGIFSDGNDATISGNTASENGYGIISTGDNATITGNTASDNQYGIGISDTSADLTLTGNIISRNSEYGLEILKGSYSPEAMNKVSSPIEDNGSGSIYNNYFGNDRNVCATTTSALYYNWTNPDGPTLGTNIVGGKYIAGNYWSNAHGNGWSDEQTPNESGYSQTAYEILPGVNDMAPLIRTPTPTPTPTPTQATDDDDDYFADHTDPTKDTPGIHFVIVSVSLPDGTRAGETARLALTLKNSGSIQLSPQARIILVPANALAQPLGEQPAVYQDGRYVMTFLFQVPTQAGTYVYTFNPVQLTKDPATGKDIRIPAGDPVQFTITVNSDGTVTVSSP